MERLERTANWQMKTLNNLSRLKVTFRLLFKILKRRSSYLLILEFIPIIQTRNEDNQMVLMPNHFMVLQNEVSFTGPCLVPFTQTLTVKPCSIPLNLNNKRRSRQVCPITRENTGRQLAILIDGKMEAHPASTNQLPVAGLGSVDPQQEQKTWPLLSKKVPYPCLLTLLKERLVPRLVSSLSN